LALKHSTKALQIKLKGKWATVNPREWTRRTDFSISVGMGTGNPEVQLQKLMALAPFMQQAGAMGLVGPQEAYNYLVEIWKNSGYKLADKFVHEPQKDPNTGQPVSPPQQPDPMVQAAQIKAQSDMQGKQLDMQTKQAEIAAKQQADSQQNAQQLALQQSNDQRQAALDQQKMGLEREKMEREFQLRSWEKLQDIALEQWKTQFMGGVQSDLKTKEFAYDAQKTNATETAKANAQAKANEPMVEQMRQLHEAMNAPKRVVRGPDGRVQGVEQGGKVRKVTRDANGRVEGLQ
jgi:hypothetical protein